MVKQLLRRFSQNPQYSMPLILLVWGILYILFGALINKNNGLGFDGKSYAFIIKNFYFLLSNNELDVYQIHRIFPLFLANLTLTILKLPKEDYYIIKYFQVYNLILLVSATYIWYRISNIYRLELRFIWMGFIIGFVNFGIAEMTFFDPVLTDTTAFFLGFCLLYFHLKDNLTGKIIITILGSFTWPSFMYFGFLLIVFPVSSKFEFNFNHEANKSRTKIYIALLIPLIFFIISIYNAVGYFSGKPLEIRTTILEKTLYVNAVLNLIVMTYIFYSLLPDKLMFNHLIPLFKKIIQNIKIQNILICLIIYLGFYVIKLNLEEHQNTMARMIYLISCYSISKPFSYFVTAVTYYGPVFIVVFFFLNYFKPHIYNLGLGLFLSFIFSILMIFSTETRVITNFFPFIILLGVLALKDLKINKTIFIAFTLFSFILSKVYIPMNNVPSEDGALAESFPSQLFFMNSFIISNRPYVIQGFVILLITIYLVIKIKRASKNSDT